MVQSIYDQKLCRPQLASVTKEGYVSFMSGIRSRYVLRRMFDPQEALRVVTGDDPNPKSLLRELLAGDFSNRESQFRDLIFQYEARFRPLLLELVTEPEITERVRQQLFTIGVPADLDLIMRLPPPHSSLPFPERWRYALATALVQPETEEEWGFLHDCALNKFDDRWVDSGAILALELNASSHAQQILEEAQEKNKFRSSPITRALEYIASNPPPLSDTNLEALAKRAALIIGSKTWQTNGTPRFNEVQDKALVDFNFQTAMDRLVYTASFHKKSGNWSLRGVRETSQAFAPALVAPAGRPK